MWWMFFIDCLAVFIVGAVFMIQTAMIIILYLAIVVFSPLYKLISLILLMKCVFKRQEFHIFGLKLN